MPQIIISENALEGIERCRSFLFNKNPLAQMRASKAIQHHISALKTEPNIGRPFETEYKLRELIIPFGDSGYILLYRFDDLTDQVVILAFRHQKEVGY
ncbi:MAG: plasmid stabilization protein [Kangiella sp.]|nr:MAG: plasmid stabilization protein [Kangiella sp.]